jgi:putative ABC transport system permease protein
VGQKFVGSHGLADEAGQDQGHDHAPFVTVGILAPTGGVADRLILTSVESVWQVHGIESHHDDPGEHDHHDHADEAGPDAPEPELTALLVTYRNAAAAMRVPAMINRQSALQAAVPATETARLLDLVGASLEAIRLFAWLLAATGGLAILVALIGIVRARAGDLALLRVMGAGRAQVVGTVMLEGVLTALGGAVIGWVAAHGLIMAARAHYPTLAELGLAPWQPLPAELAVLAGVIGIGALAALIPAIGVYRLDPARVLARS